MDQNNSTVDKSLVVIVADTHINSRAGLRVPVFNIEGETSHATRGQRWLWDCWLDLCAIVSRYDTAASAGAGTPASWRKTIVFQGDLGELDTKRRTYEIVTPNKAYIQGLVQETIAPLLGVVDSVVFIRGTPAHQGKSSWLEEAIAQDCTITNRMRDSASWYWYRGSASGVRFDLAHHLMMGGTELAPANAANKLALAARNYYYKMEIPLPHIVSRSHNHRRADSGHNFDPIHAVCTAAFSLRTEYVYRSGREYSVADIGADLYECADGKVNWIPKDYPIKEARRIWTTSM